MTEENYENSQSGYSVFRPRFEPGSSQVQVRSVIAWAILLSLEVRWHHTVPWNRLTLPEIRPRSLPSMFFPIHYSPNNVSLLAKLLNELYWGHGRKSMIGGNVAQGFSVCSNSYACFSTAPSGLYQAIQRVCRCRSHHVVISTNIRMNRMSRGLNDIRKVCWKMKRNNISVMCR